MSKQKTVSAAGARGGGEGFLQGLFHAQLYKRTQGRITRQVTCAVIWLVVLLAAWQIWARLSLFEMQRLAEYGVEKLAEYGVPGLFLAVGLWLGYRLVNYPRFADFLIAVEAEMNKVSWPSKQELIRSSIVVMFVIFVLAFLLFAYDAIWKALLKVLFWGLDWVFSLF